MAVGVRGLFLSLYSTEIDGWVASVRPLAFSTSCARRVGSFHSVFTILRVSAFTARVRTTAMITVHHCVFRLYQPETRSMVSLNQPSMFLCARLRSPFAF